ncbi:aminodeoxychorismate synthase component I [Allosphingosinicella vermicomposti]|uniref:aminodeoxychorismate synthase component I n=1 Tax=Allosphingosinicella vermicomposti TaxID=614671 RepID=UPI000D10AD9C|nr:aminodeoxychorismate synthase component I [Allosphingosinicella vermicomposti]
MIDPASPFLLFDDARFSAGPARMYMDPLEIVTAHEPGEVRPALDQLRAALAAGFHVAGYLAYEAGHALEPRLAPVARSTREGEPPLLWFGLFRDVQFADPKALLPPAAGSAGPVRPLIEEDAYCDAITQVKAHIAAGNIYQANFTFQTEVDVSGDPLALYAAIRERAKAGHGGIVRTEDHWLLSFSPELFFTLEKGRITTRPMKGTAPRHPEPAADAEAARLLAADEKQRAENLMIVDLLRNDLSRIARTGSVTVPHLFTVETYPTVHQMTSTVTAEAEEGIGAVDIIEAIFPCGSITGAPKIRAMEIIDQVEARARGVYTGSIGWVEPGGDAAFNVAIRTLSLADGSGIASLGLGSGIVTDSRADDEWRECLSKGRFVQI